MHYRPYISTIYTRRSWSKRLCGRLKCGNHSPVSRDNVTIFVYFFINIYFDRVVAMKPTTRGPFFTWSLVHVIASCSKVFFNFDFIENLVLLHIHCLVDWSTTQVDQKGTIRIKIVSKDYFREWENHVCYINLQKRSLWPIVHIR